VFDNSPIRRPRPQCPEDVTGIGFVANVGRPPVQVVGRGLFDHGVGDVEPHSMDAASRISASRQLECRRRAARTARPRRRGGDEVVLPGRIETVCGEAPEVEQVGTAEIPVVRVPPQSKITACSTTGQKRIRPNGTAGFDRPASRQTSYHLVQMSVPTRTVPVPTSIVLVAERVEHRLAELLGTEIERWGARRDLVEPLLVLRRFVVGSGSGCGRRSVTGATWGLVATRTTQP
jgi:hypothetical protein